MNADSIPPQRAREDILGDLLNMPSAIQGAISAFNVRTSSGNVKTYHRL